MKGIEPLVFLAAVLLTSPMLLLEGSETVGVERITAYILTSLAFSSVGILAYYRGLEFLTAGSTHASFLAVTVGYLISAMHGLNLYYSALPVGLILVYTAGYLVYRGMDPVKVSSFFVSFTTALGVLVAYYTLTRFPAQYSLSSIMLGDPVLMTRQDAVFAMVLSVIIVAVAIAVYRPIVFISVDPVSARVSGLNMRLYDLATFTLIGLATIGLLRVSGYIMEHVMIFLPPLIGARFSTSSRDHFASTLLSSTMASVLGYTLALNYGLSPVGLSGLILIAVYVYFLARGR
ncbi:MAG: metal ABC transporter permease [Desulfurococcus sp.]|nr:metal ABC transporter permease [Desulfurococcus sp.]